MTGATKQRKVGDMPRVWSMSAVWLAALAVLPLTGCSLDSLLKSEEFPPGVADPVVTKTPAGALAAYRGTIVLLRAGFGGQNINPLTGAGGGIGQSSFVAMTGRLSDELDQGIGGPVGDAVDRRTLLDTDPTIIAAHSALQMVRGQASQAIGLLRRYVPEDSALVGHMYALQAYSAIFLAELFCSGIPLSTIDFDGDYTHKPGSTTEQVFNHALALLDTGLALAADSARFVDLIRVGQGRAQLALGQYAAAAMAVAEVPDNYSYAMSYNSTGTIGPGSNAFSFARTNAFWGFSMANLEGGTGLDYRTSGDPRTRFTQQNGTSFPNTGKTVFRSNKYLLNGTSPIVLASGIEARLIEAEAALQAKDYTAWLDKLNHLRQTAYPTIMNCPAATCSPATSPLPDLTDPGPDGSGTDAPRVDLMFRERAFWLFLTGHRQGDMRRLVRPVTAGGYGLNQAQVYPTGEYSAGSFYGTDVAAPIPSTERALNPLYTGCASTGA